MPRLRATCRRSQVEKNSLSQNNCHASRPGWASAYEGIFEIDRVRRGALQVIRAAEGWLVRAGHLVNGALSQSSPYVLLVAMKTREADCRFPVLGFTPDREIWGFLDLDTLTSCGPRTLKDNMQSGMELVDVQGRRWIVRSIRRMGRGKPLVAWLISHLLSTPQSRIEHELDAMAPLTLDDVKDRVRASLEAFPEDYCHDDERDTVLAGLLESVRAAKDIATLHELLGLDSFTAY